MRIWQLAGILKIFLDWGSVGRVQAAFRLTRRDVVPLRGDVVPQEPLLNSTLWKNITTNSSITHVLKYLCC
jgi:hypothetical protein